PRQLAVHAAIACGPHQNFALGQIGPFREVERHQPLFDARRIGAVSRPQDQTMTIDGVWLPLHLVRRVGEAFRRRRGADALGDRLVALDRAEFGFEIGLAVDALARDPRIEEIGPILDLGGGVRRELKRAFEPVLADIAPRADYVGDDVDMHACRLVGSGHGVLACLAAGYITMQSPSSCPCLSRPSRSLRHSAYKRDGRNKSGHDGGSLTPAWAALRPPARSGNWWCRSASMSPGSPPA